MHNFTTAFAAALFAIVLGVSPLTAQDAPPVRVMSFNLRNSNAKDGENRWEKRKDLVIEVIKKVDPDLLGTQETLADQRAYLENHCDAYAAHGVGREDGKNKGEQVTMFYRKARFEKLDAGHFWLSKKPDEPGSKSWDTSLTRMASWLKLRDRKDKDAAPIVWINTHFDHRGEEARFESAKLIRQRIVDLGSNVRVIVTGDFNAGEDSKPYEAMFEVQQERRSPVVDTFRVKHAEKFEEEGTFNGFGPKAGKARIDWIACSKQWQVEEAAIVRWHKDGRWPSDHFPVMAVLSSK